jgi:signal transduction histidine kinase
VRVEATEIGRYPAELEGALYFCCREALRVAAALGARPVLRIWEADHAVHFEVAESGGGSDLAESDLTELRDRVEALGGRLTIGPGPEGRTRLNAAIPVATSRPRPDRE